MITEITFSEIKRSFSLEYVKLKIVSNTIYYNAEFDLTWKWELGNMLNMKNMDASVKFVLFMS